MIYHGRCAFHYHDHELIKMCVCVCVRTIPFMFVNRTNNHYDEQKLRSFQFQSKTTVDGTIFFLCGIKLIIFVGCLVSTMYCHEKCWLQTDRQFIESSRIMVQLNMHVHIVPFIKNAHVIWTAYVVQRWKNKICGCICISINNMSYLVSIEILWYFIDQ